ncbi:hypothetical protein Bca101_000063 [Brassica carinata]
MWVHTKSQEIATRLPPLGLKLLEFSFVEFALLQNLPLVWNGPVTGNVMLKIVSLALWSHVVSSFKWR